MQHPRLIIAALAGLLALSAVALAQPRGPSAAVPAPVALAPVSAPVPQPLVLDTKTIPLGDAFTSLPAAKDRTFRMRKIELAPGARLPMQAHGDRPAIIYIAQGVVLEHRDGEAKAIERQTGDRVLATAEITHSWENAGTRPATLLVTEILPPNVAD